MLIIKEEALIARRLPYFKFFVSEWSDGDITLEDYKTQGVFINICAYYWSNECSVKFSKVKKKFKNVNKNIFDNLINCKIMKIDSNDNLIINFLDEQKNERLKTAEKNKINGSKGGRPITQNKPNSSSSVSDSKTQTEDNKKKEEKKKKREDKTSSSPKEFSTDIKNILNDTIGLFPKNIVNNLTEKSKFIWMDTIDKLNRIDGHDYDVIKKVIIFGRNNNFWAGVFLSVSTLRDKKNDVSKFEQIKARMEGAKSTNNNVITENLENFEYE